MKAILNTSAFSQLQTAAAAAAIFSSLYSPGKSIHFCKPSIPTTKLIPYSCNSISLGHTISMSSLKPSTPLNPNHRTPKTEVAYGEIHVIVGPMFAGKTTKLLRRIQTESSNGRNVAIIKSDKDTRYGLDSIVTHDGEKLPCWPLADLSSFVQKLGPEGYDKLEVIGIDEAQFFEDLYDFCSTAADRDGKTVIVAGLDGDYLRRRFGSLLDIIPIADSVTKLTARCDLCGKRAFFTLRKTEETETELIAGAEVYMPVCRKHYMSGQAVKDSARSVIEAQKVECSTFL